MDFDLELRSARLGVGEFSDCTMAPRDSGDQQSGIWRAQLGSMWHREMQTQTTGEHPDARFEVTIRGAVMHRGWKIHLDGRIDQVVPTSPATVFREIKTITRAVPVDEADLRADYPHYFVQLAAYLALSRLESESSPLAVKGELLFVETCSGLSQTVAVGPEHDSLFTAQLERVVHFLELHRRARVRRRQLRYHPAFAHPRPGQEDTLDHLVAAMSEHRMVAFEAPTGFGKTGVMLEAALKSLKSVEYDRVIYCTSKATGQIQVVDTLRRMTASGSLNSNRPGDTGQAIALWHVRNKAEHCVNHAFHCVRDQCRFLNDLSARWNSHGLDRFHLFENSPRDLKSLREAGRHASVCPYEITRTSLAFQDVWVGDYNYVFAPRNRTLFHNQPGWNPARTLLIVDESHNLPGRVADAYSHQLNADSLRQVLADLDHVRAPRALLRAWEILTLFTAGIKACDALDSADEDDLLEALNLVAEQVAVSPLDFGALRPGSAEELWRCADLVDWLRSPSLTRLLWSPRDAEVAFTCLDAAPMIASTLREYGRVILASATIGESEHVSASWGLEPGELGRINASTPWRSGSYDVAVDLRVDTRFRQRQSHHGTTAQTIARLTEHANEAVAVFFPSYAYAEAIERKIVTEALPLRIALQPRLKDLAAQTAWVEESLGYSDALFLVLGSSFAEGIDLLGGRISHAMIVGPSLPEVNPRQHALLDALQRVGFSREAAFDRVYRVPGIQKVNQGLGRLVRAPGHRTKVLLHCRRFVEPAFARLLAIDYQFGEHIATDQELGFWLNRPHSASAS